MKLFRFIEGDSVLWRGKAYDARHAFERMHESNSDDGYFPAGMLKLEVLAKRKPSVTNPSPYWRAIWSGKLSR